MLIVGAGFAGAILARCLRSRGQNVVLVERNRHPRFALGESSTPLANLSLERLALRYDLEDLYDLAAHGRWVKRLPSRMRGLKRGFTFYSHQAHQPFDLDAENANLLMVAASADQSSADTQWLRADVDHHLVERAVAEGVTYLDETEILSCEQESGAVEASGVRRDRRVSVSCAFLVVASGASTSLLADLGVSDHSSEIALDTRLLYSHFAGVPAFSEVVGPKAGGEFPYPEQWSAVHHLLDCGWMYQLRFDDHRLSAGLVLDLERLAELGLHVDWSAPAKSWQRLLDRFPSLASQFEGAEQARPIAASPRLQYRRSGAIGERFALLPHAFAFFSPLFSTGIAWSLVGVERLAELLSGSLGAVERRRYQRLLEIEAQHQEDLMIAAYRALGNFSCFAAVSSLYFAAASFSETCQRLLQTSEWPAETAETASQKTASQKTVSRATAETAGWAWRGFLGSTDKLMRGAFREARERAISGDELVSWVARTIQRRNVAGLCDPKRRNLYPLDAERVLERAGLLGLDQAEAKRRACRLRSPSSFLEAKRSLRIE